MANEKTTSISFQVAKGGVTVRDSVSLSETLSGTDFIGRPVTVTTSWTAIPLGDLASFDLLYARNTDATNYIQIATANDGTHVFAKLTAGRACFLPVDSGATLYWKANSASVVCNLVATEP